MEMKATYCRDREHNYMVLEVPEKMQGNAYQVRMLLENEIPGLLRCKKQMVDGKAFLCYEITSRQPLSRVLEQHPAGYEEIQAVAQGIGRALEQISRFFLEEEGLILEPEFLYMDVETREISVCFLPFFGGDFQEAFRELAEYLLKKLNHKDERAILSGYRLYMETSVEDYCVKDVVGKLYQDFGGEKESCEKPPSPEQTPPNAVRKEKIPPCRTETGQERIRRAGKRKKAAGMAAACFLCAAGGAALVHFHIFTLTQAGGALFLAAGVFFYAFVGQKEKTEQRKEKKKRHRTKKQKDGWTGETKEEIVCGQRKVLEEVQGSPSEEICDFQEEPEEFYGQTMLLQKENKKGTPVLVSLRPDLQGSVTVSKEKFTVGKMKGQADLLLDLPVISRIHAQIEKRGEDYFLMDLNSTNGTFLNGKRLASNEYRQICGGDEIFFAETGYLFEES